MFLTYNGINLALTSIDRVSRDTIWSDDGTTVLYVEHTISVSGVYHPPVGGVPDLGGTAITGTRRGSARSTTNAPRPRQSVRGSNPNGAFGASALLDAKDQGKDVLTSDERKALETSGVTGFAGQVVPSQTPKYPTADGPPPPAPTSSGSNPKYPYNCVLPNPGAEGWAGPINTDRELELRLRVPRKKLLIWAFDSTGTPLVWLESPRRDAPCDAKHGPVCLNTTVRQGPNGVSMFVSMDFRTWLTPAEDGSDRPLISHRWHMVHTEDEDHYLTRLVTGEAVFDLGNLLEANQNPDWFRRQLFHPIPLGFKRSLGPIDLSPDGTTLRYQYSDTDQRVVFDASDTGATNIDIKEYVKYTHPWRGVS